ncbi:glycerophosphoryl diester phosphodiesterase [Saccharomonospora amisosensis]|uniref:glycerophosphodiester phosphodiesterase n=2 Tax=Saccharomonospora amisosensis TaxID=1128677 RepID=A0A7X5ZTD5_9PSEU|nr:glycerophosphoryl diester phosphodiesterase [Saccharomonospora amisosensis]
MTAVAMAGFAVLSITGVAGPASPADAAPKEAGAESGFVVVGHRGASGYRPEHTLASYELAARMGADYIEPDLVTTKDGVLVARHEPEIGGTTDVASHPEFADRKTTKVVDGEPVTGWFAEDFTLSELKTLRAQERIPQLRPNNTIYDGRYQIPTLQEVIDLAKRLSRELHREIGIYPETKHPTYFRQQGLALEPALVRALRRNGLDRPNAKVYVQSFEVGNLVELNRTLRVPLVQLIGGSGAPYDFVASGDPRTYDDLVTPEGLAEIATYADGLGPTKDRIIPRDENGYLTEPTALVDDAHRLGLAVHPWTFRAENAFLPAELRSSDDPAAWGDILAEYETFLATGIDGVFADQPDIAVEAARQRR